MPLPLTQAQLQTIANQSFVTKDNQAKFGVDTIADKPLTNYKGVVSSNSVLDQKQSKEAMSSAGGSLVSAGNMQNSPTYQQGQMDYTNMLQSQYMNQMVQGNQQEFQANQNLLKAQKLVYDTALRSTNYKYDSLMGELENNYTQAVQIADVNAAALNPYSMSQGSMTANNFKQKITSDYQTQAANLQRQAQLAEEELAAQNYEAYVQISNNMQKSNQMFQQNMTKAMLDFNQQANEQANADRTFGLQSAQFNLQASQAYEGNFFDFVENFGADPAFKSELQNFQQTGQITEALKPLIDRGIQAGLSPEEAIAVAQHETANQAKMRIDQEQFNSQMQLGWYNASLSQQSLALQRQKYMDELAAANQGISNTQAYRASNILDFGAKAFQMLGTADSTATGRSATASLWLPGAATDADTLQGYYDSIKSNISLAEMQKLKDESKTGSTGFGQQSDMEFKALRDSMGQLNVENSYDTQVNNLATILSAQQNIIQLHAAATGQINYSPKLITPAEVKQQMLGSTTGTYEYNGQVYNLPY